MGFLVCIFPLVLMFLGYVMLCVDHLEIPGLVVMWIAGWIAADLWKKPFNRFRKNSR